MSNKTRQVGRILETINKNTSSGNYVNSGKSLFEHSFSAESLDSNLPGDINGQLSIDIESSIIAALGIEDIDDALNRGEITQSQLKAAVNIAKYAVDPYSYLTNVNNGKLKKPNTNDNDGYNSTGFESVDSHANGTALYVGGSAVNVKDAKLGIEQFDPQKIQNALDFSVTYNFGAARQDSFAEAFFPIIVLDPMISGFNIETEFTSIISEYTIRNGSAIIPSIKKVPLIRAIYDDDIFSNNRNKIVPIYDEENDDADKFLEDFANINKETGYPVTTAPLKVGITYNLLGLTIDEKNARTAGTFDNTDALDRTMSIERIYVDIGDETFKFNTSILTTNNFTAVQQGNHKDMMLNFTTNSILINTSLTTDAKGQESALLKALPANHIIRLEIGMSGNASTAHGDVEVFANKINIVEIIDASGNILPDTQADYISIKNAFSDMKIIGYDIESYRTNTNLRIRGQLITNDRFIQQYTVPFLTGIAYQSPLNNAMGVDGDAAKISSQIEVVHVKTSLAAVNTLLKFVSDMRDAFLNNTIKDLDFKGIAKHHVKPYFHEYDMNLADHVDGTNSNQRIADINAALVNQIRDMVLDGFIYSDLIVADKVFNPNGVNKPMVIIGTDPKIKSYLSAGSSKLTISEDFEALVVSTPNAKMKNKIIMMFGYFDDQRNTTPNPLNSGQCAWRPTINIDIQRTNGTATFREIQTNPSFLHIINTPIVMVINLSDINAVLKKLPIAVKAFDDSFMVTGVVPGTPVDPTDPTDPTDPNNP